MIMDRKYIKDLINWSNDEDRKPLLILGARQVGKTYLIEELFAKIYFKNKYLRIDCSDDYEFVNYVMNNDSLQSVLDYIQIRYDFKPDSKHLLVIDEAQECLPIIKMMKHFCEKRRDILLIVTGSLVRIKINRDTKNNKTNKKFLFPVGKINQLMIYPLTFDEFLYNYKKSTYDFLLMAYKDKKILNDELHNELMDIFKDYLFIGGMPEAVNTFIKYKSNKYEAYKKVVNNLKDLYNDYLADMQLYQASQESIIRSRLVFQNIYSELNKENKNFKCSMIEPNLRNRDLVTPIDWLVTANVINKAYLLKEIVTSPLVENDNSLYRLYLSDMGLFTYQSKLDAKTFTLYKNNSLSGIYYENYISTELVARNFKLFYWKGKRNSELEFILDINSRIIPIDAKKNKGTLNSINEFRCHNKNDIIIKVSSNKYGYSKDNKILTIPYYYFSFFLNEIIKENDVIS